MRHDNIKHILTSLLAKVGHDVEAEPHLQAVTAETMDHLTANTQDESRPDIKARGFWQRGQTAFFDIRVTNGTCKSQANKSTATIFEAHEAMKKREYLQRIVEVENGLFTPLIFGTNGGVGSECSKFISTLATKLSEKNGEEYGQTVTWLRTRLSFETIRAQILCVRGSRVPFRTKEQAFLDFNLMNLESENNSTI